jgi:hypothetical protein
MVYKHAISTVVLTRNVKMIHVNASGEEEEDEDDFAQDEIQPGNL